MTKTDSSFELTETSLKSSFLSKGVHFNSDLRQKFHSGDFDEKDEASMWPLSCQMCHVARAMGPRKIMADGSKDNQRSIRQTISETIALPTYV